MTERSEAKTAYQLATQGLCACTGACKTQRCPAAVAADCLSEMGRRGRRAGWTIFYEDNEITGL